MFDPVSIGLMVGGLGLNFLGGMGQAKEAKKQSQLSAQIYQQEILANQQRRQAMELDASRRKVENIRTGQLARAQALTNATNQSAQFGSGLQGGLAQVTGRTYWNELGINQNLQIGQNLFNIDEAIGGLKTQISSSQSRASSSAGLSEIGNAMFKVAPTVGQIFGGGSLGGAQVTYGQTQPQTWGDFYRQIGTYNRGGMY